MTHRQFIAALACAATVVPATAASAAQRRAQPLIDIAPAPGATFKDKIVRGSGAAATAHAAQASARPYTTADGQTVNVTLGPDYAQDENVAQSYVDFLGSLLHGSELGSLNVYIGTPQEVTSRCGADGIAILACYLPADQLMIVPGDDQTQSADSGVTTSYVVAHEYGHHIANHRSNAPFSAMLFGPKRWASAEHVCARTLAGRLAPGNESQFYAANPGEAWAETYAQLRYPGVAWQFTSLLKPTAASRTAAKLDVTTPWTRSRVTTFSGSLGSRDTQDRHTFRLSLDGALSVRLSGPRAANYDLVVRSDGKTQSRTKAPGSHDQVRYAAACVKGPETVSVTVVRRSGSGPYTLKVTSAG